MSAFVEWDKAVTDWEGGWANDPNDAGGKTNRGITIGYFQTFAKVALGIEPTEANLRALTEDQATKIKRYHWNWTGANLIKHQGVAMMHADMRWAFGQARFRNNEALLLAGAKRVPVVGNESSVMKKQAEVWNSVRPSAAMKALHTVRTNFHQKQVANYPSQKKFINGWMRRAKELYEMAQKQGPGPASPQAPPR